MNKNSRRKGSKKTNPVSQNNLNINDLYIVAIVLEEK